MGGSPKHLRLVLSSPLAFAAVLMSVTAPAAATDSVWRSRVAPRLLDVYDSAAATQAAPAPNSIRPTSLGSTARFDADGRVQVDVQYDCSLDAPTSALRAGGLSPGTSVKVPPLCTVEGWAAPAALPRIATVAGVARVKIPVYVSHLHPRTSGVGSVPPVTSARSTAGSAQPQASSASAINANGVSIMRADQFVSQTQVSGTGVTVGVQSVGASSLALIQGRHELPAVQVVLPGSGSASSLADEGTVLLEEIHAVAPGAGLAFCEPMTTVDYASCLSKLIGAGSTILVDDIVFPDSDLMSTDNPDAQAVEQILTQNPKVALFTVVGNSNGSYWEGTYAPVSTAMQSLPVLSCAQGNGSTQVDAYVASFGTALKQTLTVTSGGTFPVTFAWADPAGRNASNFDVYWFDDSNAANSGCYAAAGSTDNAISPSLSLNAGSYSLYIATPDASLSGKFLKLWVGGDGLTSMSVPSAGSIVSPQAFASDAITVGAVNGSDGVGNSIEVFSSLGPITVAFPSQAQIPAPALVAPDGINVDASGTYFVNFLFPDGNFYGTSASVPNAGAVAALLWSAFPNLTVAQMRTALQSGATQLAGAVPDATFGFGRIDALGALGTLPSPTITALQNTTVTGSAASGGQTFSITGTGSLHFSITSSNAALVPPSVVAAGTPGVTVSPPSCGTSTLTCTLSVTPALGVAGSANLTISAVDGANRAAAASMTLTSNDPAPAPPAPPAPPATVTVASKSGGGGSLDPWWLAFIGMVTLLSVRRRVSVGFRAR